MSGLSYRELIQHKAYKGARDKHALFLAWSKTKAERPKTTPDFNETAEHRRDVKESEQELREPNMTLDDIAKNLNSTVESKERKGLNKQIIDYLKGKDWTHKGEICRAAVVWGYLGETCGRTCRTLAEEGVLEVKREKGQAIYKLK